MSGFLGGGIGPTAIKRRSGLAAPVPVAGAELLLNPNFDSDTAWSKGAGWTIPGDGTAVSAGASGVLLQNATLPVGMWWLASITTATLTAAQSYAYRVGEGGEGITPIAAAGVQFATNRKTNVVNYVYLTRISGPLDATIDAISLKQFTLSSLFSTRAYASADCDLSAAVTRTAGTQAGLVARLDSAASPANFIIAYLDGAGNVKVDKCVAGVYTAVITGAVTYVAGRVLRLVCSGNNVSAYYNSAQVGSTTAVADAGIVSNKNHGLFSTYAANTFAGYAAA